MSSLPPYPTVKKLPAPPSSHHRSPNSGRSLPFAPNLDAIRTRLRLTPDEFKSLRRALKDAETAKPKTLAHHQEDEDWLQWALKAAKKYGPSLVELLTLAL